MVGILVVGTGSMGWNHARVCSSLDSLVGVCDQSEEASAAAGHEFAVPSFTSLDSAIRECSPDALIIATPTTTHLEVLKTAAGSNLHSLIEKPIANDIREAKEISKVLEGRELICSVGHIERYNPVIKKAKEIITGREFGEVITTSSRRVSNFPGRIRDVGVILDLGIHDIDNSIYLMGSKPVSVYCVGGTNNEIDFEDHVTIIIHFENGRSSIIEVNWITPMKVRKISMTFDEAFMDIDYMNQDIKISSSNFVELNKPSKFQPQIQFETKNIPVERREPLFLEIEDFISSIEKGKPTMVPVNDGILALRVAEAAKESLNKGEVIHIA
tara:strand:- start:85 stop:1068 length:984 start_codon:yes stop_codon:yes gene_type:complete